MIQRGIFDAEYIKNFLNADRTGLITDEPNIIGTRSITGVHKNLPFSDLAEDPYILGIAKAILGSRIYIHQSRINFKSSVGSNGWSWHSDFETWHAQDGMPDMRCLTVMIPLTENTEFNGPLMVIPGSQDYFYSCKKEPKRSAQENFADQKEGVPDATAIKSFFDLSKGSVHSVKCSPGDIVFFDCNIIHGSVPNMTPFARTNLFFVYNSIENQLVRPFSVDEARPEEMGTRNILKIY